MIFYMKAPRNNANLCSILLIRLDNCYSHQNTGGTFSTHVKLNSYVTIDMSSRKICTVKANHIARGYNITVYHSRMIWWRLGAPRSSSWLLPRLHYSSTEGGRDGHLRHWIFPLLKEAAQGIHVKVYPSVRRFDGWFS